MAKDKKVSAPKKVLGNRVKLGIKERFVATSLFPESGDLVTIRIMKDIREKVELTQVEMIEANVRTNPTSGNLIWDDKGDKKVGKKMINLTSAELGFFKDQIELKNKAKKLTEGMYSFIEIIENVKTGNGGNGNSQ